MNKFFVFILNASHAGLDCLKPSKVGEFDEALAVDQPYLQWLGPALLRMRKGKGAEDHVFSFAVEEGSRNFKEACQALGFVAVGVENAYQMRHGSASTDALENLRTLAEIKKRGRWQSDSSVRRYVNGGRLPEVFARLSPAQHDHCIDSESKIGKILRGQKPPVPLLL